MLAKRAKFNASAGLILEFEVCQYLTQEPFFYLNHSDKQFMKLQTQLEINH